MRVSIVIPTLNEESNLGVCLSEVRREHFGEIIVVDGGSSDSTPQIARAAGIEPILAERGLASQCNAGAAASHGDWVFFLAADSIPGPGWAEALARALSPYVLGGGFMLALGGRPWLAWGGNFRSRYRGVALADQGLFARRAAFDAVGGMDPASLVPHARLSLELSRRGEFVLLAHAVASSPRKYDRDGTWRTVRAHARTFRRFWRAEAHAIETAPALR